MGHAPGQYIHDYSLDTNREPSYNSRMVGKRRVSRLLLGATFVGVIFLGTWAVRVEMLYRENVRNGLPARKWPTNHNVRIIRSVAP